MPDYVLHGGVRLQKTEVAKTYTKTFKDENYQNKTAYVVEFKNGIKVAYGQSPTGAFINTRNESWGDTETNTFHVMGLELKGTKYSDSIKVNGGSLMGIDVEGDHCDYVEVKGASADTGVARDIVSKNFLTRGCIVTDKCDNTKITNVWDSDWSRNGEVMHINKNNTMTNGIYRYER